MAADDDITQAVLSNDEYQQARATVRQTFGFGVERKLLLAIATLFSVVALAPLIAFRQDLIRSLEGAETYVLLLGVLALQGILTTTAAALLLLRQYRIIQTRDLETAEARRLVRMEDLFTWFLLLGTAFVSLSVLAAGVGVLSPGTVERLYESEVFVYREAETIPADVRYVSAAGGFLGFGISLLLWSVRS